MQEQEPLEKAVALDADEEEGRCWRAGKRAPLAPAVSPPSASTPWEGNLPFAAAGRFRRLGVCSVWWDRVDGEISFVKRFPQPTGCRPHLLLDCASAAASGGVFAT